MLGYEITHRMPDNERVTLTMELYCSDSNTAIRLFKMYCGKSKLLSIRHIKNKT